MEQFPVQGGLAGHHREAEWPRWGHGDATPPQVRYEPRMAPTSADFCSNLLLKRLPVPASSCSSLGVWSCNFQPVGCSTLVCHKKSAGVPQAFGAQWLKIAGRGRTLPDSATVFLGPLSVVMSCVPRMGRWRTGQFVPAEEKLEATLQEAKP